MTAMPCTPYLLSWLVGCPSADGRRRVLGRLVHGDFFPVVRKLVCAAVGEGEISECIGNIGGSVAHARGVEEMHCAFELEGMNERKYRRQNRI